MAAIYKTFPDLRRSRPATNPYTAGVRGAVSGVRQAVEGAVPRRRFKMSRASRKRIAEAQRKRWAEWRKNSNKDLGNNAAPAMTANRPPQRMSIAQRRAVSARMKKYWAERRKKKKATAT
jgi:hypothetical protein